MSLVDSDHIVPARERHGAHYFPKADHAGVLKPAMKYRYSDGGDEEPRCPKCFWLAFSRDEHKCWRCGSEM